MCLSSCVGSKAQVRPQTFDHAGRERKVWRSWCYVTMPTHSILIPKSSVFGPAIPALHERLPRMSRSSSLPAATLSDQGLLSVAGPYVNFRNLLGGSHRGSFRINETAATSNKDLLLACPYCLFWIYWLGLAVCCLSLRHKHAECNEPKTVNSVRT